MIDDWVRAAIGPVGAFLPVFPEAPVGADDQRDAVRRLEAAGYRTAWTNEIPGKDALVTIGVLLAATERLVLGTCVANMWVRPPSTAHAAASLLSDAFPHRFVLGLGVGYPAQAEHVGRDFGSPLGTARSYLDAMGGEDVHYPRLLGAIGPKMLRLAAESADGALPAGGDPGRTAEARRVLGDQKLLIVYIDVAGGDASAVAAEHLDAGADHVVLGGAIGTGFAGHVERLLALAPEMADLGGGARSTGPASDRPSGQPRA